MLQMILSWCEYVFPKRESFNLVELLKPEDLFFHLRPTSDGEFVFLLPFSEPNVRACIHEAKFKGNEKAWRLLGAVLHKYLRHCKKGVVLLPIPLSSAREKTRGYNQVFKIAEQAISNETNIHLKKNIIVKTRDTVPQTSLNKKMRMKNIEDAFVIKNPETIKDCDVIIVDDVFTTGATLREAKAKLTPHQPASITLLSLSH